MISRATVAHATALATIHSAALPPREVWGEDAIFLQLGMPGAFGLIDERGGMLLGRVAADQAEVLTLAVAPAVRRQGIASGLLRAAKTHAATCGAAALYLEVATRNEAALALYRREGFSEAGRRLHYYADASDALVMCARLPAAPQQQGRDAIGANSQ
jgi:ribosomal-protein-alanine N-acetyltransferase